MVKEILLLGNEQLYEVCEAVEKSELDNLKEVIHDLHDTLMDYKDSYGAGRAIAAPQIGVKKRLIYMYINQPVVLINPVIEFPDNEMMKVLDDCMSFPGLYVYVMRHTRCTVDYIDTNWKKCTMKLEGDLSELLQHEYDHLDGITAVMRAIDLKSFVMKGTPK
jgi:peptide deformylase